MRDIVKKREAQRRWRERHPDRVYANSARWRANNPEKVKDQQRRSWSLDRRTGMQPTKRQQQIANMYLQMGIKQISRLEGITDRAATKLLRAACRNDEGLRRAVFAESAQRHDNFVSPERIVAEIAMAEVERDALHSRLVRTRRNRREFDTKMAKLGGVDKAYIRARHLDFDAGAASLQARHTMQVDWIMALSSCQRAPSRHAARLAVRGQVEKALRSAVSQS